MSGLHAADPPAIVLQASGPNSLGIIRSLAREGVRVIACDHDPKALGLLSRHATPSLMADPLSEPERFLADLGALGRSEGGGVLFPTHDEAVAAIGPHEAEIGRRAAAPLEPLGDDERAHRQGAPA